MTELGEIPNNWEVKKLDEISNITRLAGAEYSDIWETDDNGTIIALKGNNIGKNNLILNDIERITEEMSNRLIRSKLFKNDIVFPCVGTIGKATVINEDNKYHINQNIAKITPSSGINSLYLSYYLMSDFTVKEIFKYNTSSSQPNVLVGNLRKFNIIVPSTEEQEKIASILSIVDEQIDNVDALIEKNKELKKGLMQTLLTKGIGHAKFKKTEIGEIPEEWEVMKLKEICNIKIGGTPSRNELSYWDSEKKYKNKWISIKDLSNCNKYIYDTNEYITELGIHNSNVKMLEPKTVIMSFKLSIGKMAITTENMYTNEAIAGFTELNDNVYYEYLYYIIPFLKYDIDIAVKGSTLNKEKLNNTLIALPRYNEQIKISSILSELDEKIEEYEKKKQKLEVVKKGLMQQLLTGCIRVN